MHLGELDFQREVDNESFQRRRRRREDLNAFVLCHCFAGSEEVAACCGLNGWYEQ